MSDTSAYPDEKATPIGGKAYSSSVYDPSKESVWTRIGLNGESFKRAPGNTRSSKAMGDVPPEFLEQEQVHYQQTMKPRHLQMIAVAGTIGTGLFIGSGSALADGGPAGILIAWAIVGVMLMNVTQALGEMSILYPVSGGFYTLASRMLDPAFAFAMGWNYLIQWAIILPLELTVANTTVQYWPNSLSQAEWITIFYVVILIAVLFGTIGFAEEEFWSSLLRIVVAFIFLIIGVVCICGGGPKSGDYNHYIGGSMWQNPGAFANGFKGVCSVFVTAAFSFSGTELVGLAAAETADPGKTMPKAIKQTFWRVTMVYIVCLTIIGLAIPYDDPRLPLNSDASSSPFVILMVKANINGLDHLVNVTILIAVLSIGLSAVYAGSRMLTAIAEHGYAPKCFTYIDKAGRPLWSVIAICAFGPIAYINCAPVGGAVLDWLLALSGLSTLFTWLAITVTHIRFRRAWKVQGHSVDELPYQAFGGVYGSWLGSILIVLVVIAQFYTSVWPIGEQPHGAEAAETFFMTFLSLPILIVMWVGGFLWKRTLPKRAEDIDLDTGRKSWLTPEEGRALRAERAAAPLHIKLYRFLFA